MLNRHRTHPLFCALLAAACTQNATKTEPSKDSKQNPALEKRQPQVQVPDDVLEDPVASKDGITLYKLQKSRNFENVTLDLNAPEKGAQLQPGAVRFAFDVYGYDLGKQTYAPPREILANSAKGQHIHFIVDNDPYVAKYEPEFTRELEEGHHVILAFLSRSYHESVKGTEVLQQVTVGNPNGEPIDLSAPHLFYSRPKGTYVGKDSRYILLDFFLSRVFLTPQGNKVQAIINGTEFELDAWSPYVIAGLPMGENEIRLRLVDVDGDLIEGPYNDVTRTITLKASESNEG